MEYLESSRVKGRPKCFFLISSLKICLIYAQILDESQPEYAYRCDAYKKSVCLSKLWRGFLVLKKYVVAMKPSLETKFIKNSQQEQLVFASKLIRTKIATHEQIGYLENPNHT